MRRPARTVRVTTKEELDTALATADQVVVEGDDELLTYAVNKAAGDHTLTAWKTSPSHRVTVERGIARFLFGPIDAIAVRDIERRPEEQAAPPRRYIARVRSPVGQDFGSVRAAKRTRLLLAVTLVGLLAIIAGAAVWLFSKKKATPVPGLAGTQPGVAQPGVPPPYGDIPPNGFWANLPSLLWPVVAIVAIVALFLIARQAISTDRNVTIVWKVTEKVSGRLVITKVRERTPRRQAA